MLDIFRLVEHLSESDATVLISGESGTGKELVARAVHIHSPRRKGPFIAVNCGALPGELLESELFGHVRGAFTGAVRDRVGRFELAAGGTIFLDEVGDLPLHLQVKLLRVLQEKTFERVGDSATRTTDARVIAATNKNLRQAVHDDAFRDDLYYRLRVVPIEIPPLRERREDIEPLARHLLARVGRRHDRSVLLSPDAMRAPKPGSRRCNLVRLCPPTIRSRCQRAMSQPVRRSLLRSTQSTIVCAPPSRPTIGAAPRPRPLWG
jgi:transcriptional regulator with GAF, ATPase, and Fis domain